MNPAYSLSIERERLRSSRGCSKLCMCEETAFIFLLFDMVEVFNTIDNLVFINY